MPTISTQSKIIKHGETNHSGEESAEFDQKGFQILEFWGVEYKTSKFKIFKEGGDIKNMTKRWDYKKILAELITNSNS